MRKSRLLVHHLGTRKSSFVNGRSYNSYNNGDCLPSLPLFKQVIGHAASQVSEKKAIIDFQAGTRHSYRQLISDVMKFRKRLLEESGAVGGDLNEARVVFLCPSGYEYVVAQWSIWSTGGIAVPLCTAHPPPELLYYINDSRASVFVTHPEFHDLARDIAKDAGIDKLLVIDRKDQKCDHYDSHEFEKPRLIPTDIYRRAMIIYTSGTSGKPKGVVSTHANLTAQVKSLVDAWRYTEKDKILHVLPLHHLHGILNALTCTLYAGGTVEMMPKFDASEVWNRLMKPERDLTLFMAVPTIYSLPVITRNEWKEISGGQILLERYGMSEIGMGLSHEYEVEKRYEESVPLPGVQVRLISEDGKDITDTLEKPGELQIKGPGVFKEYWNKPAATSKEFTEDGWFKTGDVAIKTDKEKVFKIHGRSSIDIIKSGAYKISALEVEYELLSHPNILEVAVIGIEDHEWGQKVAALESKLDLKQLREFCKTKLASYKVPTMLKVVDELPRNAMGKVNKRELIKVFE
ncbi:7035_t:CDS:10 [Acaulospora morrowiae]|uniref:7035_t:CDS:1 n=1 Tax=Acaulospora morrowiae TaxID=94023 RepID=A0A9N9CH02_9GLOM|nr:7035_t:CDS:10 [Acaulospora morrowiae]